MRYILILWAIPIVLFWGWFALSVNDIQLGTIYLSKGFNDHMMGLYGKILGVEPSAVPGLIAGVFAFDTAILLGIAALRWHKSWLPQTMAWVTDKWSRPKVYSEFNIEKAPPLYFEPPVEDGVETAASINVAEQSVGQALPAR